MHRTIDPLWERTRRNHRGFRQLLKMGNHQQQPAEPKLLWYYKGFSCQQFISKICSLVNPFVWRMHPLLVVVVVVVAVVVVLVVVVVVVVVGTSPLPGNHIYNLKKTTLRKKSKMRMHELFGAKLVMSQPRSTLSVCKFQLPQELKRIVNWIQLVGVTIAELYSYT